MKPAPNPYAPPGNTSMSRSRSATGPNLDVIYPIVFAHSRFWILFSALGSLPFSAATVGCFAGISMSPWSFHSTVLLIVGVFLAICSIALIDTIFFRVKIDPVSVRVSGLLATEVLWSNIAKLGADDPQVVTLLLQNGRKKIILLRNSRQETELMRDCLIDCFSRNQ